MKGNPKPKLTAERIVAEAITMADGGGIEAVTMRQLARRLGVKAMSLYHHLADKEALLSAMVEAVVATMERPDPEMDWKVAMRKRALGMRAALLRHGWAVPLMMSRINIGPAMLEHIEGTLSCLRRAGFTVVEADRLWNTMDSQIFGSILLEIHAPIQPAAYAEAATEYLPLLSPDEYPHFRELAEAVADGSYSGVVDFEAGFEAILTGCRPDL
ncbi:MAG: TetR/AcrR family transcriptional regulator [Puniceicoccaceae bacterium]